MVSVEEMDVPSSRAVDALIARRVEDVVQKQFVKAQVAHGPLAPLLPTRRSVVERSMGRSMEVYGARVIGRMAHLDALRAKDHADPALWKGNLHSPLSDSRRLHANRNIGPPGRFSS